MRLAVAAARLVSLGLALALPAACGSAEPAARTYQVRGVLQSLPDPETGRGQLRIRHEAIPDLVGAGGEVEGMAAMTMLFPVAAEVDLGGLAAGDAVGFTLRVDWQADRPVTVIAIEKLPAGADLALD